MPRTNIRIRIEERGQRRERCDGQTMKGTRCTFGATTLSNIGNYCRTHMPPVLDKHLKAHTQRQRKYQLKQGKAVNRMREFFNSLEPLRRVPPPEEIALHLLRQIQGEQCFMCSMRGKPVKHKELVLDHCHETGMIRALLCKSCNSQEWSSGDPVWEAYRKYAPANRWYCRYFGPGAQWQPHWPDPLATRIALENIGLKAEDVESAGATALLATYIEKTARLEPTRITEDCTKKFLDGCGLPLFEHEIQKLKQIIAKRCVDVMKDMG